MTAQRLNQIKNVLRQRQFDATVILENVHKSHNLSAIIRNCDAVGIAEVHAVDGDAGWHTSNHTASGSQRWVNVHKHTDIDTCFAHLKQQGKTLYAAHLSDEAVDFRDIDYTQPFALLMGQEKFGVTPETAAKVDGHISIPMHGMVESLNVSVATAVILYEMQRQRLAAGLYEHCQLDPDRFEKTVFEWCQPKMARFYQDRNLPYPPLDEDGDIIALP